MAGRNKPRTFALFTAACAAAALAVAGWAPAAQADASTINYVNLGDSYSAGFGSGSVMPGPVPGCFQGSGATHVTAIDALDGVVLTANGACAGASTQQVALMASALSGQLASADLVTLSLGGNDLDFAGTIAACSTLGTAAACDHAIAAGWAALPEVQARVHAVLAQIDAQTPGTILVLGYPRLLTTSNGDQPLMTAANARTLNKLTDALNRGISKATHGTSAKFVPVLGPFNNHGINADNSWIYFNQANLADPFNLHPTTAGYLNGYYPAVRNHIHLNQLGR